MRTAADHIATLAQKTPGSPVGRRTVMRYLTAQLGQSEELTCYFGCRDYPSMMLKIIEFRPDLRLIKYTGNNGIAIMVPRPSERPPR